MGTVNEAETETISMEAIKVKPTKFDEFCYHRGINPNLIMLKITLFVMYGATSSLLPYLTIHMQSIGLTVEEIAIIYLALPFTTFLSPPITGFLVDKFGKYKPVVVMSLLLNAVFHHSLLFIPQQEIPGVVPSAFVMRHPDSGAVEVWWSPCPSRECPEEPELELAVNDCINYCMEQEMAPLSPYSAAVVTAATRAYDEIEGSSSTTSRETGGEEFSRSSKFQDILNMSATMFPPLVMPDDLATEPQGWNQITENSSSSWVHSSHSDVVYFMLQMHPDLADPIEQLGMEIEPDNNETVTDFKQRFGEQHLWNMHINVTELEELDLRCGGLVRRSNMSQISNETISCMVQMCTFTDNAPEICPPDYKETDGTIFWIYFLLRFLATIMLSAGVTIMDPIALTMIEKYGGDFGRERLFASIGMAIFSPITGIMIDYFSSGLGYTDYSAAFYTYDILLVISTISVLMMPLGDKLPADNVFRDLWNLVKVPHVMTFIFFLFILGNFWGFIESFLFLYLKELGAPNSLLGSTITVGTVSSIPFLYCADKITRIFGHVNLIIIAFFSHAGRLVGYSFIENAWWCFPFEAMEALSCHLMWVAAATYCSVLAPKNLLATLIGVLGMAHFSLGRGAGSFTGGFLIGQFGTRDAFRYMGLLAVVGGISYGLLHLVWLRKFDQPIDEVEEEEIEAAENGETEKLTHEPQSPAKDPSNSVSMERLSLMIKYNQIGSLSSLPRGSRADIHDHLSYRRSSYNVESLRSPKHVVGSASKVDILRSTLDINHKFYNHSMLSRADNKMSNQSLGRNRADSAPKLNHTNTKNISQPALEGVVLEGVESTFYPSRMKKYPSGLLTSIPAMDLSVLSSTIDSDDDSRKSIPEETDLNNVKKLLRASAGSVDSLPHGNGTSIPDDEQSEKEDAT